MFMKFLLNSCLLVSFAGCSSLGHFSSHPPAPLALSSADNIKLGVTRSEDLENLFGKPSVVLASQPTHTHAYLYCEKGPAQCTQGNLTFHVDDSSGVVRSVVWNPQVNDSKNIETLIAHYKNATFTKRRYLYNYGDYFDEVETYTNLEQGITIGFNPTRNEVTRVYREDPKAPMPIVASDKKLPIITPIPDRDTAGSFQ